MSEQRYKELLEVAKAAFQNSYAPYSKYRVGAALLSKDGRIFPGCNVEIVSYEGSICAERVALTRAVSDGVREFVAVAVAAEQNPAKETWPCGVCRQCLAEFGVDLVVVVPSKDGTIQTLRLKELLPYYFPPSELLTAK